MEGSRIKLQLTNISLIRRQTSQTISNISVAQERQSAVLQSSKYLQEAVHSSVEGFRRDTIHRLDQFKSVSSANSAPRSLWGSLHGNQQSPNSIAGQAPNPSVRFTTTSFESTYQSLMIQTPYRPAAACHLTCHCRCHLRQSITTPSLLSQLIGQIFISYKGIPTLAQSCNEKSCKRNSEPNISAVYTISWFND